MTAVSSSKRHRILNNLIFFHYKEMLTGPKRKRKRIKPEKLRIIENLKFKTQIT